MKKISMQIETYRKNGFFIDVITSKFPAYGDGYEAWIYDPDYGTKILMFGMPAEQQSYEEFLDIVEKNVNRYIRIYKDHDWYIEE